MMSLHDSLSRRMLVSSIIIASCLRTSPTLSQGRGGGTPDMVPGTLVDALLGQQFSILGSLGIADIASPHVIVGKLPSGLAQRLWVPPGATVLGGVESSGAGVAVIRSQLSRDSLTAAYHREQLTRGWTAPPPLPTLNAGFAFASASASDPNQQLTFCSGGTMLNITISPVDREMEILASAVAIGAYLCTPAPTGAAADVFGLSRRYPTLNNPPGTGNGMTANCASFNSSGSGGSTRLTTSLALDDVFAYYGKQLADSGWTMTPDPMASHSWTRTDKTGGFFELTLTTRSRLLSPGCVEVKMEMNSRSR